MLCWLIGLDRGKQVLPNRLQSAVPCCARAMLCCAALCFLCCAVLCCAVLCCAVLCCAFCAVLCCVLDHTVLAVVRRKLQCGTLCYAIMWYQGSPRTNYAGQAAVHCLIAHTKQHAEGTALCCANRAVIISVLQDVQTSNCLTKMCGIECGQRLCIKLSTMMLILSKPGRDPYGLMLICRRERGAGASTSLGGDAKSNPPLPRVNSPSPSRVRKPASTVASGARSIKTTGQSAHMLLVLMILMKMTITIVLLMLIAKTPTRTALCSLLKRE